MATHDGEEKFAQRWPAPAVAALVISTAGVLISTILTISLALFMFYANTNKEGATRRELDVREIESLKSDVKSSNQSIEELQRTNARLENTVSKQQSSIEFLRTKLKLDFDDGTLKEPNP